MAPRKPIAKRGASANARPSRDVASILDSIKSTFANIEAKIGVLKAQKNKHKPKQTKTRAQTKATATATNTKPLTSTRQMVEQILEDLRVDEEAHSTTASAPAGEEPTIHGSLLGPHPTVDLHNFELGRPLGRGKFGRVFLARHKDTNYICAIKMIKKAQCAGDEGETLVRRELEVHQNLAHPNILRFFAWFHDDSSIYLILEYAPGGSLYSRLKKQPKGRFHEHAAAHYIAQMAEALRYMHRKKIMHRDIKPENILLGLHNEIKLADFGYSVHSASGFRSTVCGTLDYLSPEVAIMRMKPGKEEEFYSNAVDRWSLGVLTYELLVGRPPFEMKSEKATEKKIAKFKGKIKFPSHISKGAEEFILELLNLDAEKRMSLDAVLQHAWIGQHCHRLAESGLRSSGRLVDPDGTE